MTLQDEIARLRTRIAAVRAERDAAQGSGTQSRYLDAVSRLEGLERDLEALRQEGYARLEDAVKFARELRAPKPTGRKRGSV